MGLMSEQQPDREGERQKTDCGVLR
jgi:hypothetical protein